MASSGTLVIMAALAIGGIVLLGVALSLPPGQGQSAPQGPSAVTAVVTSSEGSSTFTQGPGQVVLSPGCTGSTKTYGNMTLPTTPCVAYGFPSAALKKATLDTQQVLTYIKNAYEYHIVYFAFSRTDGNVMYAVLNVTGSQLVAGNWSTGYRVSYVEDNLLNVTVLQVTRSNFEVTHVSAYPIPDKVNSIAYTPSQMEAIQAALSDPKVKSLMAAPPYYVEFVGTSGNDLPYDANQTAGGIQDGSYFIQLYQVNGPMVVGAFVDIPSNTVFNAYSQLIVSGECWSDGIVITDPWNAPGFHGCTI